MISFDMNDVVVIPTLMLRRLQNDKKVIFIITSILGCESKFLPTHRRYKDRKHSEDGVLSVCRLFELSQSAKSLM
jgi:hypothetical protein